MGWLDIILGIFCIYTCIFLNTLSLKLLTVNALLLILSVSARIGIPVCVSGLTRTTHTYRYAYSLSRHTCMCE